MTQTPYTLGRKAAQQGQSLLRCPYPRLTEAQKLWLEGYRDAMEELK